MSTHPFYRLAPFIQEFIYANRWNELRDVQVQAFSAIFDTKDHVLIASGTASGKTEAAFFPILTLLNDEKPASIGVLYIGPLKALINDQFERIDDLLREADFPIFAWHGDRSQSEKQRAIRHATGILQITPESLEALLMNQSSEVKRLFHDLRFIVIDELHIFMGQDRGAQLQCQLVRLSRIAKCKPRRIGLSATINDYETAKQWLLAGTFKETRLVISSDGGRKLNLAMEHFSLPSETEESKYAMTSNEYNGFLYNQVKGRKCLIFTNSRLESEKTVAMLKEAAAKHNEPDIYHVHHGSLSTALRHETEYTLRNSTEPVVTAATRTLELGIDLGTLERVVQLGAPTTCSSFVQRLGRSGRRESPAQMRFITTHHFKQSKNAFEEIPWDLIRNIAIVQLYLEERWVEGISQKNYPYSLLFHQTLSALAQAECMPQELARNVLTLPPFKTVTNEEYKTLLQHALKTDMIQRTDEGSLIVGLAGERLTNSYRFYSVFKDDTGYTVYAKHQDIGTVDALPKIGDILLLAGQRWKVLDVDEDRKRVYVLPSNNYGETKWNSQSAFFLDDKIVNRMRGVLMEDTIYPYLLDRAQYFLKSAREVSRNAGILDFFYSGEGNRFLIHPWLGGRKHHTLSFLLKSVYKEPLNINSVIDQPADLHMEIQTDRPASEFMELLCYAILMHDLSDLDIPSHLLYRERYDQYLPMELLKSTYRTDVLDIPGVQAFFASMTSRGSE